jgi:hypothetical protein
VECLQDQTVNWIIPISIRFTHSASFLRLLPSYLDSWPLKHSLHCHNPQLISLTNPCYSFTSVLTTSDEVAKASGVASSFLVFLLVLCRGKPLDVRDDEADEVGGSDSLHRAGGPLSSRIIT